MNNAFIFTWLNVTSTWSENSDFLLQVENDKHFYGLLLRSWIFTATLL
jgi:hypothetical protein